MSISTNIKQRLNHLYLSPLSGCNLNCKMCYTAKDKNRLSINQIIDFVDRYQRFVDLESLTLCGGELFLMPELTKLVNQLTDQDIFIQLITNGTIDRLTAFKDPNQINLIVSLDGLPEYHDLNRGQGNWRKSVRFMQHADQLNFHLAVFSVVTKQNFKKIEQFEQLLKDKLGFLPDVTYHPRKPESYLNQHPKDNRTGQIDQFKFVKKSQQKDLWQTKKTFPPKQLGCYQLSVFADGLVYGCCEATQPLGQLTDPISELVEKFKKRIKILGPENKFGCQGCVEPNFVCGLKDFVRKDQL